MGKQKHNVQKPTALVNSKCIVKLQNFRRFWKSSEIQNIQILRSQIIFGNSESDIILQDKFHAFDSEKVGWYT